MTNKKKASLALLKLCCAALDSKKAGDMRVLDVSAQSSITDYLVLATATSEPHLRALRMELEKTLKDARTRLVGEEAGSESGWIVIDAFDVMVHVFTEEMRRRYGLEILWRDASEVPVAKLLAAPKKRVRSSTARKR